MIDNVYITDKFNEEILCENKVLILGSILGIEEEGIFEGEKSYVVLIKTERSKNKALYIWVLFKDKELLDGLISKDGLIFIEGKMCNHYRFNEKAISHTFIVPDSITSVDDYVEIGKSDKFHLNFTVNNRVCLEGSIVSEPWREFIPPANNYVTRFLLKFNFNGEESSVYCTIWDTVNNLGTLKKDMKIRVIGSFSLLKKERGLLVEDGVVIESKKNKLDSYVIVVQHIELVDGELIKEDLG